MNFKKRWIIIFSLLAIIPIIFIEFVIDIEGLLPFFIGVFTVINGLSLLLMFITNKKWTYFIPLGGILVILIIGFTNIFIDYGLDNIIYEDILFLVAFLLSIFSFSMLLFILIERFYLDNLNLHLNPNIDIYRALIILAIAALMSKNIFMDYTEYFTRSQNISLVFIVFSVIIVITGIGLYVKYVINYNYITFLYATTTLSFVMYLYIPFLEILEEFFYIRDFSIENMEILNIALLWYVIICLGYFLYLKWIEHTKKTI